MILVSGTLRIVRAAKLVEKFNVPWMTLVVAKS
jgi:hypothetical protein